jgi:hypothetical protein
MGRNEAQMYDFNSNCKEEIREAVCHYWLIADIQLGQKL